MHFLPPPFFVKQFSKNLHYKATVAHALLVNMFYYLTATLVYN